MRKQRKLQIGHYAPEITMVHSTPAPFQTVRLAADITMVKEAKLKRQAPEKSDLCARLLRQNHTSLFEHVNYMFLVRNITRSALAQLTRHRIGSFTSGSQHYQNYAGYKFLIREDYADDVFVSQAFEECMLAYTNLIKAGCPKEEARQVLPNGMTVNLVWTVNARSLINFLNLRMCERNVEEIRTVAVRVHDLVEEHFPELFEKVGPDCQMGGCRQGPMGCKVKDNRKKGGGN